MTGRSWNERELIEIWLAANDGAASDEQLAKLSKLLVEDERARECLIALAGHQSWLSWQENPTGLSTPDNAATADQLGVSTSAPMDSHSSADHSSIPPAGGPALPPLPTSTENQWGLDWRGLSIFLLLALATAWAGQSYLRGRNVANRAAPPAASAANDNSAVLPSPFVARIVHVSDDLSWVDPAESFDFLLRLRPDVPVRISAGLVQIEFFYGARVVVEGPAVFIPTGPDSGQLDSGKLTGEAAEGNFRLTTPAADVIDLGTAFGVVADSANGTDVVVFDGRVQVLSRGEGDVCGEPLDMTKGMAARFRVDGSTEYGLLTDPAEFQRSVASNRRAGSENELCLIDVIAGGDGLGMRLAGGLEPLSGHKDYGEGERRRKTKMRNSNGAYHTASWHPMIDGVFIPTRSGHHVQIDSAGHKIDFPPSAGRTWGPVWGRSKEHLLGASASDFWEDSVFTTSRHYAPSDFFGGLQNVQKGLVGLHANVGLTLDLRAMRLVHRRAAVEFRSSVANIDNSRDLPYAKDGLTHRVATFSVYVDGELRYQRLAFSLDDGQEDFLVPLTENDRFLTLVCTDHDKNTHFDHVVLIDPVILLLQAP